MEGGRRRRRRLRGGTLRTGGKGGSCVERRDRSVAMRGAMHDGARQRKLK